MPVCLHCVDFHENNIKYAPGIPKVIILFTFIINKMLFITTSNAGVFIS